MDLLKIIADLQRERDRLDEAILALERLSIGNAQHRRPHRAPGSHLIAEEDLGPAAQAETPQSAETTAASDGDKS